MIPGKGFGEAWKKIMGEYGDDVLVGDWEADWEKLQYRRLEVEKRGPEIEVVPDQIIESGKDAEILAGLFVPVSSKVLEAMPKLKVVGVSRAGLENVNVTEATKRGVLVFNVQGRNAHAVSDFAVGMMLAECRNIARAHYAIKNGTWRKTFSNSATVPELTGRNVGIIGFGYIGRLVAQKLSGFNMNRLVFDPYASEEDVKEAGCTKVDLETLLKESDFITLHARLTEANKNMIGEKEIALMKETAYIVNTGRAGLVDQVALAAALKANKISGAALDVFTTEPIPEDSEFLKLDNVTLTTHIAGTTADALGNSPSLLLEDISKLLKDNKPRFIVNPEVLENEEFKKWLEEVRA
ncbi:D-3-phosphoglycerate dehydrogenase [Anaerobium acetethylicum]|uniref:D-3-phosphoglycerate dehydrogenase n=2 Tax=Anaerobium acetethylicum TaxID=1619234 RepID=A0A1D3TYC9_9FIRM|nr:D-3-phosphoglycerate dehydrogenase [Anaerobium acetethylicum]